MLACVQRNDECGWYGTVIDSGQPLFIGDDFGLYWYDGTWYLYWEYNGDHAFSEEFDCYNGGDFDVEGITCTITPDPDCECLL
jgi:hypothetical protein